MPGLSACSGGSPPVAGDAAGDAPVAAEVSPADVGLAPDARFADAAPVDAGGGAADAGIDSANRDAAGDSAAKDGATAADAAAESPVADASRVDGGADGGQPAPTCNLGGAATAQTPRFYVIGDSTASVYASSLYPRMGWAQPLQDFFAPACATILDKALSGRSSKSFYDEGSWTPIRDALRAGDHVLIQFGHNDEKTSDTARGTDPFTTFQQYLAKYIDETRARGATPILLTPISRNSWSGGVLRDAHGDYPAAMRQLAQTRGVPLVDATVLTGSYFQRIGQAGTTALFLVLSPGQFPNYPDGVTDNTHLQETGARTMARMVLADLHRQGLAPGTLTKVVPVAP